MDYKKHRFRGGSNLGHRRLNIKLHEINERLKNLPKQWPGIVCNIVVAVVAIIITIGVGEHSKKELSDFIVDKTEETNKALKNVTKNATDEIDKSLASVKEELKDRIDQIEDSTNKATMEIQEALYPNKFKVGLDLINIEGEESWSYGEDLGPFPPSKDYTHTLLAKSKMMRLRIRIYNGSKYPANYVPFTFYVGPGEFKQSITKIMNDLNKIGFFVSSSWSEPSPLMGKGFSEIKCEGSQNLLLQIGGKKTRVIHWLDITLEKEVGYFNILIRDNVFAFLIKHEEDFFSEPTD